MGHQIDVLNNAASAATKRAVKARDRGNPKESAAARARALADTRKALRLNDAEKKRLVAKRRGIKTSKRGRITGITGGQITDAELKRLRAAQTTDSHQ